MQSTEEEVTPEELGISSADLADSEPPVASSGAPAVEDVAGAQREVTGQGAAVIQRTPEAVVQRAAGTCAPYNGYSASIKVASYNCAGLAHRSYDYKSLAATRALLAGGTAALGAPPGQIKHWLREYDLHGEDTAGRRSSSAFIRAGFPHRGRRDRSERCGAD